MIQPSKPLCALVVALVGCLGSGVARAQATRPAAAPVRAAIPVPAAVPAPVPATSTAPSTTSSSPPMAHVAYVGTTGKGVDSDVAAAFEAGVEKALAATSIVVIHVPRDGRPRNPDGQPCVTSACLTAMAARTGATHVVHGRLGLDPIQGQLAYSGSLEMIRIQPYQIVTAVPVACDRCIAKMLKSAVEVDTSALMGQFFDAERRQAAAAAEADAAAKLAATKGPAKAPPPPLPAAPAARPLWPWVVVGVGAATLATGIVFIALGDQSKCADGISASDCGEVRRYRPWGVGLTAAGVAVAAAGVVLAVTLPTESRESNLRVGVGLEGLSLGGAF